MREHIETSSYITKLLQLQLHIHYSHLVLLVKNTSFQPISFHLIVYIEYPRRG